MSDATLEEKFDFIMAGSMVKRYHTVHTIQTDTVGAHSYRVAQIMMLLLGANSGGGVAESVRGLWHDLAESHYGDMPSPTKRLIGAAMAAAENILLRQYGADLGKDQPAELALELSDKLDGLYFCTVERLMGNQFIAVVAGRYAAYLLELMTEVENFEHGNIAAAARKLYSNLAAQWAQFGGLSHA